MQLPIILSHNLIFTTTAKGFAMPRKPRMYLPGIPAHVVQRGNNRDACFFADEDYRYYLNALAQGCQRYDAYLRLLPDDQPRPSVDDTGVAEYCYLPGHAARWENLCRL